MNCPIFKPWYIDGFMESGYHKGERKKAKQKKNRSVAHTLAMIEELEALHR
jgi:hypothetical protein